MKLNKYHPGPTRSKPARFGEQWRAGTPLLQRPGLTQKHTDVSIRLLHSSMSAIYMVHERYPFSEGEGVDNLFKAYKGKAVNGRVGGEISKGKPSMSLGT